MNFSNIKNWTIGGKEVTILTINEKVFWKKEEPVKYSAFYIENPNITNVDITVKSETSDILNLEYSKNNINWTTWTNKTVPISLNAHEKVYLRGVNKVASTLDNNQNFVASGDVNVGGDLTTLLVPKGNVLDLTGREYTFTYLFRDMPIIDASELVLPSKILSMRCYFNLFLNCKKLIKTPSFYEDIILADSCYQYMFWNCISLTTAPELPATTLADSCYASMFYGCTSLTQAPKLPATTLAESCYWNMFSGCTSLTTAPELPATTLAKSCCNQMFYKCTSLTTAPELPAMELEEGCYSHMFASCTSLVKAPILPATTLAKNCYMNMFKDCTSLVNAPTLHSMELANGCYGLMFYNCTSLTKAPALPATELAYECYEYMFSGCPITTMPELPATKLAPSCYYGMFSGCNKLTKTSIIQGLSVEKDCFNSMFMNCSSLREIKIRVTNWDKNYAKNWVSGVASTGNVESPNLNGSLIPMGVDGVPEGWKYNGQTKPPTLRTNAFKFTYKGNGVNTIKMVKTTQNAPTYNLQKSYDGFNYTSCNIYSGIVLNSTNRVVYLKGDNSTLRNYSSDYNTFTFTDDIYCDGSVLDLIDNGTDSTSLTNPYQFLGLFKGCTKLKTAPLLPSKSVVGNCYTSMFEGCTSLVEAPELPASLSGGTSCYTNMFKNCTSLKIVPDLTAISLSRGCYSGMFEGCTSLEVAPRIMAYRVGITSCRYMFKNCTSLKKSPVLEADSLNRTCYEEMFNGCTSLTEVTALFTSIDSKSLDMWLDNVAPNGVFYYNRSLTAPVPGTPIPAGWTSKPYQGY